MDKSSIFFSKNTPLPIRDQLAAILQVPHVGNQNKYLGLPAIVQRSKRATFHYIKDKVNQKLQHWKRSLLSPSGREVLIKAVATAVPLYTLSCFKLPETLLNELQRAMLQFWWGQKRDEKRLQWVGWKTTCRPRIQGGLNFKDLKAFNLAMLAKQGWRLLTRPNSLIYKVYRSKYFRFTDFLRAEVRNSPSWGWQSVLEGRKVLEKDILWKIGRGTSVRIREDSWVSKFTAITPISNPNSTDLPLRVLDLILPNKQ
ncbi:putative mitochondrial protein [Arachis hypogaea]|nr:putative mitochondrial protein [Arachis hypogaea]